MQMIHSPTVFSKLPHTWAQFGRQGIALPLSRGTSGIESTIKKRTPLFLFIWLALIAEDWWVASISSITINIFPVLWLRKRGTGGTQAGRLRPLVGTAGIS